MNKQTSALPLITIASSSSKVTVCSAHFELRGEHIFITQALRIQLFIVDTARDMKLNIYLLTYLLMFYHVFSRRRLV